MGEPQTEIPDQKVEEEGIKIPTITHACRRRRRNLSRCLSHLAPPHELTEEEKLQILHSEEFANFFDHSTRIIERALSEHVDLFFDYSGRDLEEKEW